LEAALSQVQIGIRAGIDPSVARGHQSDCAAPKTDEEIEIKGRSLKEEDLRQPGHP
jgi:hypothetical protein